MASTSIIELTDSNICKICHNALGKYTCPRCNILYCSLVCYQSKQHLECSENFYEKCVMENMKLENVEANDESKAKMNEILSKMYDKEGDNDELDSDDEEYLDLGERLAGINLDDTEKVWAKLTSDERQEFEAFLRSGDISKLIKQWEPWWMYNCENKILDIDEFEKVKKNCPKVKSNIKNFSSISKKLVSDTVQYNLINVITAYVFTLRYFNGEYREHTLESVACISKISLNLHKNLNFENFDTAVDSVQQQCITIPWIYADEENLNFMREDVHRIFQGPHSTEKKFYILCCLSDMSSLFKSALKIDQKGGTASFSKTFPESKFPEVELEEKDRIKLHIKKFDFYLSFVQDLVYA